MSTSFTKRVFNFLIPQFDLLTLGAQVFGLLISLSLFYYYCIKHSLTYFIEIKKYRTKKLNNNVKFLTTIDKDLKYNLWLSFILFKKFIFLE